MIRLSDAKLTDGLPKIISGQAWVQALAVAVQRQLRRILDYAQKTRSFAAIEDLDESVLDALAIELNTPLYRQTYPIEVKQQTVKNSLAYFSRAGTVGALSNHIQSIYGGTSVEEWFDYGGTPGCFRVNVNLQKKGASLEDLHQLVMGIGDCKNVRSHLDGISITCETQSDAVCAACMIANEEIEIWPEPAGSGDQ